MKDIAMSLLPRENALKKNIDFWEYLKWLIWLALP